jgi:hypothetical protein
MSSPGTLRFGQVATKPSAPPVGYDLIYVKTDDVLYIQDSSGIEVALGSASAITSLSGEATGSGPGNAIVTLSNSAVIGKVLTGFTPGPNSPVLATDSILQAFEKLQGQFNATAVNAITALTGDVSATGPGSVTATVNSVGGKTASDIASAVTTVDAATSSNTASTLVERDASGNFSANIITASLNGNAATSTNFTGSLSGDVSGTQTATSVNKIQGTPVNATTPTDAQVLIYNSTASQWIPESISGDINITHSGAATIQPNVVSNSKLAQMPANTVKANTTGSTANASDVGLGTVTESVSSVLTLSGWTDATIGSPTIQVLQASNTQSGYLSSADWSSFSNKTGTLSGDVTTPGGGSGVTTVVAIQHHNVSSTAPTDAQFLVYNTTGSQYNPVSLGGDVTMTDAGVASLVATTNSTITTLSSLSLPGSQITGTVAIAHGGTGQTTANAGFDALSPMTTAGDLIYENSTPTAARLPIGTTGEVLTVSGGLPVWASPATSGTVTSVALADGSTTPIYAITGSPVTSSGTLTFTLDTQPANEVFAGPVSGPAAQPTFRSLVSADIPNNAANTTGTASNITATSNSTLTTLTALSLPTSQLTGTLSSAEMLPLPTNDIYVGNGSNQPAAVAMSGDVNIVSSGATTIQPNVVTNSKLAQMPANTLKGNNTGSTANAADLTVAQVNTMLGTVTSVTASSPLQSSGGATPNISFINENANTVLAGPTSGGAAAPTFRALVSADIPPINLASTANGGVTGVLNIANGGTDLSTTPTNGQLLIGNGTNYTLGTLTAGTGISITNAAGSITVSNNQTTVYTTKTANYTILSTDGTIFCDTSGGAFTLTLPSPTGLGGKLYRIIDSTGNFQTNNLTLAPSASEKIEGLAASKILQTPWGWFTITTNGTDWYIC